MRPVFSASEVDRVKTCLASAVLPRTRETTPGQAVGLAKHRFLERCNTIGRTAALLEIQDETLAEMFAAINLEGLPLDPAAWVAELALCWDFETGRARELGRGIDRRYDIATTEIPGTADSAALAGGDGCAVLDYKPEFLHQPRAQEHGQLRLLALMMARAFGRERARVEICRPRRDEKAWIDRWEFDLLDLAEIAEDTRALALAVVQARLEYEADGVIPEPNVTELCKRCPCSDACPAQGAMLVQIGGGDAVDRFTQALNEEGGAKAWHWLRAAHAKLDKMDAVLDRFAEERPFEIGGGRIYGLEKRKHSIINPLTVFQVVSEIYGIEVAWQVAELKVTQKRIENVMRKIAEKTGAKMTHLKRQIQEAAGTGWREEFHDELRVHRAPKAELAAPAEDAEVSP